MCVQKEQQKTNNEQNILYILNANSFKSSVRLEQVEVSHDFQASWLVDVGAANSDHQSGRRPREGFKRGKADRTNMRRSNATG